MSSSEKPNNLDDDLACFIFMLSLEDAFKTDEELEIELRPPRKHWRDKLDFSEKEWWGEK